MNTATRGKTFEGTVVSAKMQKTVIVEWEGRRYIPKYERYEKTRTRVSAHNPENINAQEGDRVQIKETRPLSKTKHFIITKVLGKEDDYILEKELGEEGKHKKTKKQQKNLEKTEEEQ
ncbi:30S ribosomal protein S17 [Candidatus Woesearchaeota archaeon]|nr:MAG: 30S ribosomal protein S17 [Candidatus Woesearchaeota archaeon]